MATQTTNYKLTKPDPNADYYNIEVHNNNADIIDAALKPTADPYQVPSGLTGKIVQWVSWITNRIKAITGKSNWYDNPATTLEAAKAHADAVAPHSGHETPDGALAKVAAAVTAHEEEADPHEQYALDTELAALQNEVDEHKAECAVLIPKSGSTANAILLDIVLTDKKKGSFRALANNTGNVAINGKAFKKDATTQIPAGGIKVNKVYDFYYDEAVDSVFILAKTSGTAQPSYVLAPYTFSNDDGEQVGTIPSKSAQTYTPSQSTQTIASGQYLSGTQTISAVPVDATKVLTGTTIAGKAGTMPNQGAKVITPSTANQAILGGYHNGSGYVKGDADLVAGNIKSGVNIFGVAGSSIPYAAEWTQRTSSFGASRILRVCYGNGMFVAAGAEGKLATSADGITWSQRISSFTTLIRGVCYGNDMFVIVGDEGKLATSSDGITWTQRTSSFGTTDIYAVAYGNGMFVIVGESGKLATSPDGITWTQRTSSFNYTIRGVCYGNDMFVAVGTAGELATSADGITWTQRTSSFTTLIYSVCYGNGMFVAVGATGKLATSTNGITWTQRTSSFSDNIYGVYYGNSMFVAVGGAEGKLATSINGITWAQRPSSFTTLISGVCYGNGMFVAVGDEGKLATLD